MCVYIYKYIQGTDRGDAEGSGIGARGQEQSSVEAAPLRFVKKNQKGQYSPQLTGWLDALTNNSSRPPWLGVSGVVCGLWGAGCGVQGAGCRV